MSEKATPPDYSGKAGKSRTSCLIAASVAVIVLPTALLLLSVPLYSILASKAYEAHLREIEAIGESVEIDDLRPPRVANSKDNFAEAPIVRTLREESRDRSRGGTGSFPLVDALVLDAVPGYEARRISGQKPLVRYVELAPLSQWFPDLESDRATAEAIVAYCDKHARELDELLEASRRPRSNLDIAYEDGFAVDFSDLKGMQDAVKLANHRGRAYLELEKPDKAAESVELVLRFGEHLGSECSLIHQLVAITFEGMALATIQEGLRREAWERPHLDKFDSLLRSRNSAPGFLRAMRMERGIFIDLMMNLQTGTSSSMTNLNEFMPDVDIPIRRIPSGWLYDNARKYSEILQDNLLTDENGLARTDTLAAGSDMTATFEELTSSLPQKFRFLLATTALPAYTGIQTRIVRIQVQRDHVRLALAIERYRIESGNLPDSLDELRAFFPGGILSDPFTGAPYRYTLEEDSFQIHSVGPNQRDEGGLMKRDLEDGDWVWRLSIPEDFDYGAYRASD